MTVKSVKTFKRTVTCNRPGPGVDEMIAYSFVSVLAMADPAKVSELRSKTGGLRDTDFAELILKGAEQVKDDEGNLISDPAASLAYVLADPILTGATVKDYYLAVGDGVAGKNSKT